MVVEIKELRKLFELEFYKYFSCNSDRPYEYNHFKDIFTDPYFFAPYEEDRKRIDVIRCYSRIEKISCSRDFFCRDLFLSVFILAEEILKDYYKNLFFYNSRLMINYSKDSRSLMRKMIDAEDKENFLLEMANEISNSIIGNKRNWLKDLSGKSAVDHEQRGRKTRNSPRTAVRLSQSLEETINSLTEIRNQVAHEGYHKPMSEILNDFQPYEIKSRDFNSIDKLFYKGELLSVTFIISRPGLKNKAM